MESRIEETLMEYVQNESAALPEGLYLSLMNLCAEHNNLRDKVTQLSLALRIRMRLVASLASHARQLEQDKKALEDKVENLEKKNAWKRERSCVETRSMKKNRSE